MKRSSRLNKSARRRKGADVSVGAFIVQARGTLPDPRDAVPAMIRLTASLQAWGSPDFPSVLKEEIGRLDAAHLPLQQGLTASSHALEGTHSAMVISVADKPDCIQARVGIFYSGILAGCSCADDPTPVEPQNEYCEVLVSIRKTTAETSITPVAE